MFYILSQWVTTTYLYDDMLNGLRMETGTGPAVFPEPVAKGTKGSQAEDETERLQTDA